MAKRRFQPEQIIGKLREAEVDISKGQTIGQIVKKLGITEQTYHRWRKAAGASGQAWIDCPSTDVGGATAPALGHS